MPRTELSPQINVELVGNQEVFGRHADGITSQPHPGYPTALTENISNLGKLSQPLMLKAWHTHGNTSHGGADFYPLLAKVGKDVIEGEIGGKSITDMACKGADF